MAQMLTKPIARGRTAEVYAWGEDRVLKLFYSGCSEQSVRQEARITGLVHAAGLPVPGVEGVVEQDGRLGIVFERIAGVSMLEIFLRQPWRIFTLTRRMARLHAHIHTLALPELPAQRPRLQRRIAAAPALADDLKEALLARLEGLPDGQQVCHGDFHPGNILLTPRGAVVIDWIDATCGNRLADVARTRLLVQNGSPPPGTRIGRRRAAGRVLGYWLYRLQYARRQPFERAQLDAWATVVAGARLAENLPAEQEWLLRQAKTALYG